MDNIRCGYADCGEGQIHFRETGDRAKAPLCFFHQTASSSVMFEKVMARLADDYWCLAFDSPGFGQSYRPAAIPSVGYMTDRLLEAITDLGIDSFHACGHHTGGCAALEMPARFPGRVRSLTLIGPVLVNEQEKAEYKKTFVQPFTVEQSGAWLQTAWDYLRQIGADATLDLHVRELCDHVSAHRAMPQAFSGVWDQDVAGFYERVDVPLMIMCSKDDVLWPLFERAARMRPDAKQCIVGGADFQCDRDPDGVADGLRAFLGELP